MNIYCKEYGDPDGSSIVFIHGGGMTGEVWNSTLQFFKDYHCMAVDLPEHGPQGKDCSAVEGTKEWVDQTTEKCKKF